MDFISRVQKHMRVSFAMFCVGFLLFTVNYAIRHPSLFHFSTLSTFQIWAVFISGILILVAGGYYLLDTYFRSKQNQILEAIGNARHIIFENLKISLTWKMGARWNLTDLILLDNQMILLIYKTRFMGLFKEAQPSFLFYRDALPNKEIAKACIVQPMDTVQFLDGELKIVIKEGFVTGETFQHFMIELNKQHQQEMVKQLIAFNLF